MNRFMPPVRGPRTAVQAAPMLAVVLTLAAGAALARDTALVLGAEDYETLGRVRQGAEVAEATDGLTALGFEVQALANPTARMTSQAIGAFLGDVDEAERVVVVLSGRFATDGSRSWYLTADAARPAVFGLGPGAGGVSVESVLAVLADHPAGAVLLLGVDSDAEGSFDPWIDEGLGRLEVPQGVTVLMAEPQVIADFVANEMAIPGGDLAALVEENGRITAEGYLPRGFVFAPATARPVADTPPVVMPTPDFTAESALWAGAVALNSPEGYADYLRVHPRGRYAAEARAAVAAILAEPGREARLAEEALALTRDQRRQIQRELSILDFDTRGIDGIFGPGTRSAVTDWQQSNGFAQTSYLDGEQVARIAAQAARRSAQVEAEAQAAREAVQAADRAYWEESGANGDEAGLRAYLERYPEGLFSDVAADRIALVDERRRREAQAQAGAQDRAAWDATRAADTVQAYDAYLRDRPQGAFTAEAQARRASLAAASAGSEAEQAAVRAARATEEAIGLNALTARVIEQRLDGLGLDPGDVDGRFDNDTRRALREYQRDSGIAASGYLDEGTLVRLLADSLGQALRD